MKKAPRSLNIEDLYIKRRTPSDDDDTCGRKTFSNYVRLCGEIFVEGGETYVRIVACSVGKIEATFGPLALSGV